PKRREALIDNADLARISKQLVTLANDAPVPVGFESMIAQDYKRQELYDFLKTQGFKTLLTRLGQSADVVLSGEKDLTKPAQDSAASPQNDSKNIPYNNYTLINDMAILHEWIDEA